MVKPGHLKIKSSHAVASMLGGYYTECRIDEKHSRFGYSLHGKRKNVSENSNLINGCKSAI